MRKIAVIFAMHLLSHQAQAQAQVMCQVELKNPSLGCHNGHIGEGSGSVPCTGVTISLGGQSVYRVSKFSESSTSYILSDKIQENSGTLLFDPQTNETYRNEIRVAATLPKDGSKGALQYSEIRHLYVYINGVHVPSLTSRVAVDIDCSAILTGVIREPYPEG